MQSKNGIDTKLKQNNYEEQYHLLKNNLPK